MADVLKHLKDTNEHVISHKIIKRKDVVKKTIYHLREPIESVFSVIKELLKFSDINRTSYIQHQAINVDYLIIYSTSKFSLTICKWNRILTVQKTWVGFKQVFRTSHREL